MLQYQSEFEDYFNFLLDTVIIFGLILILAIFALFLIDKVTSKLNQWRQTKIEK